MSERAKHTPGPFRTYEDRDGTIGIYMQEANGTCGAQVAVVVTENLDSETCDQARADAALFAASPELLQLLETLYKRVGESGWHNAQPTVGMRAARADLLNKVRGVIQQAKGGAT